MYRLAILCTTLLTLAFINATSQSLPDLFEDVSESVVVIGTESSKQLGGGTDNKVSEQGLGSGVLISNDGLIWTAAHVVQLAENLKVKFRDGSMYFARVVSTDPTADVAMIQVDADISDKRVATVGNSDSARIGEDVFVIGAPRGLEYSLSRGIISGRITQHNPEFGGTTVDLLQMDAAINPGNSGGPVFQHAW